MTFHQPPSRALSTGRSGVFLERQGKWGQIAHKVSELRGVPIKGIYLVIEAVGPAEGLRVLLPNWEGQGWESNLKIPHEGPHPLTVPEV